MRDLYEEAHVKSGVNATIAEAGEVTLSVGVNDGGVVVSLTDSKDSANFLVAFMQPDEATRLQDALTKALQTLSDQRR